MGNQPSQHHAKIARSESRKDEAYEYEQKMNGILKRKNFLATDGPQASFDNSCSCMLANTTSYHEDLCRSSWLDIDADFSYDVLEMVSDKTGGPCRKGCGGFIRKTPKCSPSIDKTLGRPGFDNTQQNILGLTDKCVAYGKDAIAVESRDYNASGEIDIGETRPIYEKHLDKYFECTVPSDESRFTNPKYQFIFKKMFPPSHLTHKKLSDADTPISYWQAIANSYTTAPDNDPEWQYKNYLSNFDPAIGWMKHNHEDAAKTRMYLCEDNMNSPACKEIYSAATAFTEEDDKLFASYCTAKKSRLNEEICRRWCKHNATNGGTSCDQMIDDYCVTRVPDSNYPEGDRKFCSCYHMEYVDDYGIPPNCIAGDCHSFGYKTADMLNLECPDMTNCIAKIEAAAGKDATINAIDIHQECSRTAGNEPVTSETETSETKTSTSTSNLPDVSSGIPTWVIVLVFFVIVMIFVGIFISRSSRSSRYDRY